MHFTFINAPQWYNTNQPLDSMVSHNLFYRLKDKCFNDIISFAMTNKEELLSFSPSYCNVILTNEELETFLKECQNVYDFRIAFDYQLQRDTEEMMHTSSYVLVNETSCLGISSENYEKNEYGVSITSMDKKLFSSIKEKISSFKREHEENEKSSFSMASVSNGNIFFESIDITTLKFNEKNYSSHVVEGYKNIIENFNKPGVGKLLIMQGPPGTGKSSLIRGLLHDLKKESNFIFLPTNMLTQLITPSFLPALIAESDENKSMVLIIEDADDSLIERKIDNLGVISTLLNMTSGLLGDSLNLRIVATTNMSKTNIDPALLRPGRLFDLITIDPLEQEQAQALYKDLGGTGKYEGPGVLADIYSQTNSAVKAKTFSSVSNPYRKPVKKYGF